jgi:hypothetical protein
MQQIGAPEMVSDAYWVIIGPSKWMVAKLWERCRTSWAHHRTKCNMTMPRGSVTKNILRHMGLWEMVHETPKDMMVNA